MYIIITSFYSIINSINSFLIKLNNNKPIRYSYFLFCISLLVPFSFLRYLKSFLVKIIKSQDLHNGN